MKTIISVQCFLESRLSAFIAAGDFLEIFRPGDHQYTAADERRMNADRWTP